MRNRSLRGGNTGFLAPMYLFTVVFLIGPFVYMLFLSFLYGCIMQAKDLLLL